MISSTIQPRPERSLYMGCFAAPAIEQIRVAFIGMGRRAQHLSTLLAPMEGVSIVGICDIKPERTEEALSILHELAEPSATCYGKDELDYQRMLAELKPDAVFITVGWNHHATVACACMEAGAHAFVEVPLATSIKDLWQIVDSSEKHQRHCMMMENANYGRHELLFLNMVRLGLIGEPVHAEGAYIHDLRFTLTDDNRTESEWRTRHYLHRNGNLYPTHGLGSLSQYMNLGRGCDSFSHLVSMSSSSRGFGNYSSEHFPADHEWNSQPFACGDINTSIIQTCMGRSIMLQWDECSMRPYTRHNFIQGTRGILAGYPTRVISELLGAKEHDDWTQGEALEAIYKQYDHPLWKRLGARGEELAGKRARDYIMLSRIVHCLRRGEPLDQNVYEGAYWSSVAELSERSVAAAGEPASFPDFTRGDWRKTPGIIIHD